MLRLHSLHLNDSEDTNSYLQLFDYLYNLTQRCASPSSQESVLFSFQPHITTTLGGWGASVRHSATFLTQCRFFAFIYRTKLIEHTSVIVDNPLKHFILTRRSQQQHYARTKQRSKSCKKTTSTAKYRARRIRYFSTLCSSIRRNRADVLTLVQTAGNFHDMPLAHTIHHQVGTTLNEN